MPAAHTKTIARRLKAMNPNQQKLFNVFDHSNLGLKFELDLEAAHDWYQRQGWADVRKIPSNWVFISEAEYQKLLIKLGRGELSPGSLAVCDNGRKMQRVKSDVDFVGSGSRFGIAFDAKTSSGTNFPLSMVKPHQMLKLRQRSLCKITSGAMVLMAKYNRVFFVSFDYLDRRQMQLLRQTGPRATPGTASISMADLEAHAVEIFKHKTNQLWHWLPQLVK